MRGPDASQRWTRQLLSDLERRGLLAHVLANRRRKLWHVTPRGGQLAEQAGGLSRRPKLLRGEDASAALHAHTLVVNEASMAWLHAARARGDDFGPLAWQHEVAHPLGRGRRRAVIADALLTYLLAEQDGEPASLEFRLLELDRATLSVDRLAAKLARYADLHRASDEQGAPVWRPWYPTFPAVHVVLTGASPMLLARRRDAVFALCRSDPRLERAPDLAISVGLLADLQTEGPFSAIFVTRDGADVDWLGRSPSRRTRPCG
ncbi:MAG: hypothetical protein QOD71_445 [Thermoleophilaceae bacterium]|jgi:hypothetical protein|nr:hypothetical protein [Thermoleophilaceae bacterium]